MPPEPTDPAVLAIADQILTGEITPYRGAAEIWAALAEEPGEYPEHLKAFVGLASEWQDHPEQRDDLDAYIRDEARLLISRGA